MDAAVGTVKWVPVSTAAKLLKVSRARVYRLCEEGRLRSQNVDGTVLVEQMSIEARLRGQRMLGRPV